MSLSSDSKSFSLSDSIRGVPHVSQRPWRLLQVNERDAREHSSRCATIIKIISAGRSRAHVDGPHIFWNDLFKRSMASCATMTGFIRRSGCRRPCWRGETWNAIISMRGYGYCTPSIKCDVLIEELACLCGLTRMVDVAVRVQ